MSGRPARVHGRRVLALLVAITIGSSCSTYRLGDQAIGTSTAAEEAPGESIGEGAPADTAVVGDVLAIPGLDGEAERSSSGPTGVAGPGGAAGDDPANAAIARTASDRGVTPDSIKLGFLTVSEDTLGDLGASYAGRPAEQIIKPFIDEVNAQGGVNGRQLVPVITRFNPAVVDDMLAACVAQAEDHKVFATIATTAFYGEGEVCLANKETPTLTPSNSSEYTLYEREKGWVRQTAMNKTRALLNWVDWILESGTATTATPLGVVFTDVPEDRQVVNDTLLPYLREKGLNVKEVATFTISTLDAMVSEAQRAAFRFKASGVELVLPVTNFLQFYLFVQQAELAGYVPRYTVTDFGGMNTDATSFYPASQWTGVTGITTGLTGQPLRNHVFDAPGAQECLRVYNDAGVALRPGPDGVGIDGVELATMLSVCQHLALFVDATRRAGPNPTRQGFLDAIGNTGRWSHRVALSPPLTFQPDRYDSLDQFAVVRWFPGCDGNAGCYRRVEGFRTGRW